MIMIGAYVFDDTGTSTSLKHFVNFAAFTVSLTTDLESRLEVTRDR